MTDSNNKEIVGMTGTVIEETKNMIVIETSDGIKKLIKNICSSDKFVDDKRNSVLSLEISDM